MAMNLLGIDEIARAIGHGTRRQTVAQWHWRQKLPPPAAIVSKGRGKGVPVWREEDLLEFIAQAQATAEKREVYRELITAAQAAANKRAAKRRSH